MGAKLQLTVETNFDEAAKDFKRFGNVSEQERKNIDDSLSKIGGRAKTTLSGMKDQLENTAKGYHNAGQGSKALGAQSKFLERKIFALTKAGGSSTKAMDTLQGELDDVRKSMSRNEKKTKQLAAAKKALAVGAIAVGAALVAGGGALIKNTFDVADNAVAYGKQAQLLGMTAEKYQELAFVADKSGVSQDRFGEAFNDLSEKIGEARLGSGTLKDQLEVSNPALLEQLKNTKDSAAAFELMVGELGKTENAQDRMILATEAFGDAGKDMVRVAALGADGLAELKKEAHEYGIISNENVDKARAFKRSQVELGAAVQGVANEIGMALIPFINDAMVVIANLIKRGGTLRNMFENTVKAIIPVIANIGKIGLALFKLSTFIFKNVTGAVRDFTSALLNIPGVEKVFGAIDRGMKGFAGSVADVGVSVGGAVGAELGKMEEATIQSLFGLELVEEQKQQAYKDTTLTLAEEVKKRTKLEPTKPKAKADSLSTRLATEEQLEFNSQQKRVSQIISFLENNRLAEGASFEQKLEHMQSEKERILELDTITADERVAVEMAFTERMNQLSLDRISQQKAEQTQKIDTLSKFLNSSLNIVGVFSKKSAKVQRGVAIAQKSIDIATATVKGILATQAALAAGGGIPYGLPQAIATGAAAGANVAAIAATPIPTAQTGASIVVPDDPSSSRADTVAVAAGPGETIDVTARGEENGRTVSAALYLDGERLYSTIQDWVDSGKITITEANIQAA